ncbi:MAG: outer membrane autotransporter barrel domain-containing protein, partial [bacterium]
FALQSGSPALGAGNPSDPAFGTLPTTDQRGADRFTAGSIDSGAYQHHFTYTAPASQPTVSAGQSAAFNLGSFSYTGAALDVWQATVDWGDGSADTVFTTLSEGSLGTQDHTYTTAGNFAITVTLQATDGADYPRFAAGSATVNTAVAITGPSTLPDGVVGSSYAGATFTASGGSGAYTFTATGNLAGLAVSTLGVLSGTPTTAGSFVITVTATDSNGGTDSESYVLVVESAVAITTASLPAPTVGSVYLQLLAASGGSGSYTFSATGTLPPGLTLSRSIRRVPRPARSPSCRPTRSCRASKCWSSPAPTATTFSPSSRSGLPRPGSW